MKRMSHHSILLFLLVTLVNLHAGEIELIKVDDLMSSMRQSIPRDISSAINDSEISQITSPDSQPLDGDPSCLIDPDRSSGMMIPPNSKHTFLLNLRAPAQVKKAVLTGELQGCTISMEALDMPKISGSSWKVMTPSQPLSSPVTAIRIPPQQTFQIRFTLTTGKTPALFNDIAFYSNQDVREVAVEKNPQLRVKQTSKGFEVEEPPIPLAESQKTLGIQDNSVKTLQENFDIGSMYAGAKVAYISTTPDVRNAHNLNDDDTETALDFTPKDEESIAVLDLQENRKVRELGFTHSSPDYDVIIYVLDELPWKDEPVLPAESPTPGKDTSWLLDIRLASLDWASDVPLFAQLKPNVSKKKTGVLKINTAIFDKMKPFGNFNLNGRKFTKIRGKAIKGRYVILRFINRSKSNSTNLIPKGTTTSSTTSTSTSSSPTKEEPKSLNQGKGTTSPSSPIAALLSGIDSNLKIYQVSVFGDYPLNYFTMVPKPLPEAAMDALISPSDQPLSEQTENTESIIAIDPSKITTTVPPPPPISSGAP